MIDGCATSSHSTWITEAMAEAYTHLHRLGHAHSIEAWRDGQLVGGLYGVALGRAFFGESMFSGQPNTSKMALLGLSRHMQSAGIELLDCQVASPHLFTLGAEFMPRRDFSEFLAAACNPPQPHGAWPADPVPVCSLFVA